MPRSVGSEGIAVVRQALEGSASDSSHQQHSPSAEWQVPSSGSKCRTESCSRPASQPGHQKLARPTVAMTARRSASRDR